MADDIASLLKLRAEVERKINEHLGLSDWRTPDDLTDMYWARVRDTIYWSDEPLNAKTIKSVGPHFAASMCGREPKIRTNYTVVELDHQMGDGLTLTVLANDKQCTDKEVLKALGDW